tara:strand:- start:292 stop:741 length:450 start_codon:yes stop_codon:yes gene_type:complete
MYSTNTYLYVLKLKDNCYYVGSTKDPSKRFKQHQSGIGAAWTSLHPPVGEKEIMLKTVNGWEMVGFEEDKLVKELMIKHGVNNVRGGSYSNIHLDDDVHDMLLNEIFHAQGACLRCGRKSHWVQDCYARTDVYGNELYETDSDDDYDSE